jgi:cysteinyl-tRNA synthetase
MKQVPKVKLFNTLSRKVVHLTPLVDNQVKMYTCGLTVYSQPHIGNWAAYIYTDVLVRTLRASGYDVTQIQNITDVGHLVSDADDGEDKMEKGAKKEGKSAWDIAKKYSQIAYHEAYTILNLTKPTRLVAATSLIQEQIDFAKELEKNNLTYIIEGDGLYLDTSKLDSYGALAQLDVSGLQAGIRVQNRNKRNVTDFAIWKLSPTNSDRDMEWDSPWGKGFPGWHLECSVIARENLGDQIDIHTGGIDHIPVHHTNEIAQTEAVTKKQFSKYWFHVNHLKINGRKLSKSEGNSYTLQDILNKNIDIQAFKLMILESHYQTEGNFSWEILQAAQNRLYHWLFAANLRWQPQSATADQYMYNNATHKMILKQLQDNLNTPAALQQIDSFFDQVITVGISTDNVAALNNILVQIKELIGIDLLQDDIPNMTKTLLQKRAKARIDKNWELTDSIRDELIAQHINVLDTPKGQIWQRIPKKSLI